MKVKKHLLLCATPTKQKCSVGNEGQKTWESLKKILKDLENKKLFPNQEIMRSKVDCLQICKEGPILLIWPDGIWYKKVTSERIIEIIDSHIIKGKPIQKWIFKKTCF